MIFYATGSAGRKERGGRCTGNAAEEPEELGKLWGGQTTQPETANNGRRSNDDDWVTGRASERARAAGSAGDGCGREPSQNSDWLGDMDEFLTCSEGRVLGLWVALKQATGCERCHKFI